jgi:DMSO/TMAO reductase YedYZ heme-binding membrane subunit
MYLLVAIEITSLLRRRMSNRAWHAVHLLSYFLFATTTVHMLTAGTDVTALVGSSAAVLLGVAVTFGSVALYRWRSDRGEPGRARNPVPTPRARAGVG